MKRLLKSLVLFSTLLARSYPLIAADLTIATKTEISMDPHYLWSSANLSYYMNMYGALTKYDDRSQVRPDLALSWSMVSETQWQFVLRDRLKFSDGTMVTAQDVVDSFHRALTLPNAAGSYTGAIASVKEVKAVGDRTVIIDTKTVDPILPYRVAMIQIVPGRITKSETTADFNAGRNIVGTGPYKFQSYVAGQRLVVERNPAYYGASAKWDRVTFRFIPNDDQRVMALLRGEVDMIDAVPPGAMERLRSSGNTAVYATPSDRVLFLAMDTESDVTPYATSRDGTPLTRNPLKDRRVREALSLAIDRFALTNVVMNGTAAPAGQIAPPHVGGYNPTIPLPKTDVPRARQLLKEAGYGSGFGLTLHCTNDRYVNDANVCQAITQMLERIDVKVTARTMSRSALFPKISDHKAERFAAVLLGWGSTGEADGLGATIHSYDARKSLGTWNAGHYSNRAVDSLIERGIATRNLEQRHQLLSQAMKAAMEDVAVIPLYYQNVTIASRRNIYYRPWTSEINFADSAISLAAPDAK